MENYDHKKIEAKWQKRWEEERLYEFREKGGKKYYLLVEFPYPSGEGLHAGHVRSYTALDIVARKRRTEGYDVLYPIGWDAFGLPTENYAIKTKTPPKQVTKENTDNFRRQLKSLGLSFDWSREINTTDPAYYRWTQWIFLQFFKKGLAYKKKTEINWCLSCKIGLANEEVVDGKCERCGGMTEKREKEQWMLAITKYADRLHDDLDTVDYLEKIKIQQRNWIGRSEGAEIEFPVKGSSEKIKVFTTRPDTLFGTTYMVLAPDHTLIAALKDSIKNLAEIEKYAAAARKKTEIERTAEGREKTGVRLEGIMAVNPANKEEIPIFIADYVLKEYGTGAIMAVPAHDERDFAFAKKFNLQIKQVIKPQKALSVKGKISENVRQFIEERPWIQPGVVLNSNEFDGMDSEEAKKKITEAVGGQMKVTYKLRDWVFSRQRYWGEPIPLIHCEKDGWVPVSEDSLPVELPEVEAYTPTDSGESPLAKIKEWVEVKCPKCGGPARRETDTMPNWAGSSWYYLRYIDPRNDTAFAGRTQLDYMMPVDWYNGGMEHTTLHLLYSRFWHKFLYDIGAVPGVEPYQKRTSHGMILAEGGEKMSKSKGNVVNPDSIVETFGADTLRVYEMFMGPFEQSVAWSTESIVGPRRFLERVWKLSRKVKDLPADGTLEGPLHRAVKKISADIEAMGFNTAVSEFMILTNEMDNRTEIPKAQFETLLRLLAPFAPHIAEELWQFLGHKHSIHTEPWPSHDEQKLKKTTVRIAVQVNGKVRAEFEATPDLPEGEAKKKALSEPRVAAHLEGKEIKRVIYVPGRLINIVA